MESTEEKYFPLFIGRQNAKIKCARKPVPVSAIEIRSIAFSCAWGACASASKMQRRNLNFFPITLHCSQGRQRSKPASHLRLCCHRAAHSFCTHPDYKCCRFDHITAKIGEASWLVSTNVLLTGCWWAGGFL